MLCLAFDLVVLISCSKLLFHFVYHYGRLARQLRGVAGLIDEAELERVQHRRHICGHPAAFYGKAENSLTWAGDRGEETVQICGIFLPGMTRTQCPLQRESETVRPPKTCRYILQHAKNRP